VIATNQLRLYDYPASCNCYKVRLLLSHLGRAYERVNVDIFDGGTLSDEYAALNPARTTPVLSTPKGTSPSRTRSSSTSRPARRSCPTTRSNSRR
jgi:glutathione S-transferase